MAEKREWFFCRMLARYVCDGLVVKYIRIGHILCHGEGAAQILVLLAQILVLLAQVRVLLVQVLVRCGVVLDEGAPGGVVVGELGSGLTTMLIEPLLERLVMRFGWKLPLRGHEVVPISHRGHTTCRIAILT